MPRGGGEAGEPRSGGSCGAPRGQLWRGLHLLRWARAVLMPSPLAGVFSACHAVVSPADFLESCVLDLCLTDGQPTSLCYALQAYAQACSSAGVCLDWRNTTFCREWGLGACPDFLGGPSGRRRGRWQDQAGGGGRGSTAQT